MTEPDIAELRAQARLRALSRPRLDFSGSIEDLTHSGLAMRRYTPGTAAGTAIVFLHGGYGVFGDLDLQDGRCRRMAEALAATVLSVDYHLAPEATFAEAVADALLAVQLLVESGHQPILIGGDSAGAAVAVWTALHADISIDGLLLTSPNIDLSLAHVDTQQPESPDLALSRWSFARWTRGMDESAPLSLPVPDATFPPLLQAVGTRDGLVGDATAFAATCSARGVSNRLIRVDGEGHGLSDAALEDVWAQARAFFALDSD